jgi:hypothetical protein
MRKFIASLCLWGTLAANAVAQVPLVGAGPGGGSFASAATTWNPADIGTNGVLSGGNLIFSAPSAVATVGVRGTISKSSGKFYFETKFARTGGTSGVNDGTGISNLTTSLTGPVGGPGNVGQAMIFPSGNIFVNGSNLLSSGMSWSATGTQTFTFGQAFDLTNKLAWWTIDGVHWNSTSSGVNSPITGVGGVSLSTITTPQFPVVYISIADNRNWTLNAGVGGFTYSALYTSLQAAGYTQWH